MRALHVDSLPTTHGFGRVLHEQDHDAEWEAVRAACPELADGRGRRALYVGCSRWRAFLLPDLLRGGWDVDVVEIDEGNCVEIRRIFPEAFVIHNDIRRMASAPYGIALWAHGPEHLPERDAEEELFRLQRMCGMVVVACPVGQEELDGPAYGNEAERHLWSIPRGWLATRGFVEIPTGPDKVLGIWRQAEPQPRRDASP